MTGRDATDLPFLGTTWLRRGPAYWWRRAMVTLLALLPAVLTVAILVGVLIGLWSVSRAGSAIAAVVVVAVLAVTAVRAWRYPGGRRVRNPARAARNARRLTRIAGPVVVGLLILIPFAPRVVEVIFVLGATAIALGTAGPLLVALVRTFGRELPVERQVREMLDLPAPGTAPEEPRGRGG